MVSSDYDVKLQMYERKYAQFSPAIERTSQGGSEVGFHQGASRSISAPGGTTRTMLTHSNLNTRESRLRIRIHKRYSYGYTRIIVKNVYGVYGL